MFNFLKKLFSRSAIINRITCKHDGSIETIYIEDRIYDSIMDNDDLGDIYRTFIKVDYCTKCGKILSMSHTNKTNNYSTCYGFGHWIKVPAESYYEDIEKFKKITGIDANKLTLAKNIKVYNTTCPLCKQKITYNSNNIITYRTIDKEYICCPKCGKFIELYENNLIVNN